MLGRHLEAADRSPVAGRCRELRGDRLAGQLGRRHVGGGELAELLLLLAGGGRVDAGVRGDSVLGLELGVQL